jgi:uncharacterized protein (DUF1778 family)
MVDGDVYQIIQKGQDVKVMMTQEHYFQLMARLEKAEGTTQVLKYDPEKLMSDFENLRLSDRDFKKVVDEIENPSLPNDRMKKSFETHSDKIISTEENTIVLTDSERDNFVEALSEKPIRNTAFMNAKNKIKEK